MYLYRNVSKFGSLENDQVWMHIVYFVLHVFTHIQIILWIIISIIIDNPKCFFCSHRFNLYGNWDFTVCIYCRICGLDGSICFLLYDLYVLVHRLNQFSVIIFGSSVLSSLLSSVHYYRYGNGYHTKDHWYYYDFSNVSGQKKIGEGVLNGL